MATQIAEPKATDLIFDNIFGDAVMATDEFHEGDPVGVMACLISAFSAAIGPGPNIETGKGKMPLSFWSILVGASGAGFKGDAVSAALSLVNSAIADFTLTYVMEGFDSGLGLVTALDARAGLPVLVVDQEMSKLAKATRTDYRLNTTLTQVFDGATLIYKTGKDDIKVQNPHLGWIGNIQPEMWVETKGSKAAATGTWNRFGLVWVKQSKKLPTFPSRKAKAHKAQKIAEVGHNLRKAYTYALSVTDIEVPEHVSMQWEAYHRPEIDRLKASVSGNQAERLEAYVLRLAALYCIFDQRYKMSVEDFDSALAFMSYSVQSIRYVASNPDFVPRTTLADKVLDYVTEFGPAHLTAMTIKVGRAYAKDGGYYRAILELGGEVVIFKVPRRPGQKGPIPEWVTLKDAPLPEGAVVIDPAKRLQESLGKPMPSDDELFDHGRFQDTEEPEVVVEAEVLRDETQEPPTEPLKALPAPKGPKNGSRPSQASSATPRNATEPPADEPEKTAWGRNKAGQWEREALREESATLPPKPVTPDWL